MKTNKKFLVLIFSAVLFVIFGYIGLLLMNFNFNFINFKGIIILLAYFYYLYVMRFLKIQNNQILKG
jgi:membrane protein implicated in regulation of membrane protease activity